MAEVHASDPNKPPIRDQVQPDFPWVHIVIAAALGLAAIGGGVAAGLLFGFFLIGRTIELAAALNAILAEDRRHRVAR